MELSKELMEGVGALMDLFKMIAVPAKIVISLAKNVKISLILGAWNVKLELLYKMMGLVNVRTVYL